MQRLTREEAIAFAMLSRDERRAFVKAFAAHDLAARVQNGEIVVVGTTPDGTPIYQKADPVIDADDDLPF